jgi:acetolactate synthase-1/2/3 large subunit
VFRPFTQAPANAAVTSGKLVSMTAPAVSTTDDFQPRTTAEHLLWLLHAHGIEHLFLNPGTDSAPLQEAATVLTEAGVPIPNVITCAHEAVAMSAAHGYWQVTGRPQCVFVHMDVGTQNLGAMMHDALRDRAGVIVIAGKTPYGEEPGSPGGRSHMIHWLEDVPDQAGILRGYAKWSLEITRPEVTARAVGRAVQLARGGRPGPVYLTVARDVLMDPPAGGLGRTSGYAVPGPPAAGPETARRIADLIAEADRPLLITAKTGRHPGGFAAVTRLADLTGIRVFDQFESGCLNIATSHPMRVRSAGAAPRHIEAADLIIVAECDVPWIPKFTRPGADAVIVQIDADPLRTNIPLWAFPADVSVAADGATVLGEVADVLPDLDPAAKWAGWAEEAAAEPAPAEGPIAAREVIEALNAVLDEDDILVEEMVTNASELHDFGHRTRPGTLAGTGTAGLGWGLGGAIGISLGAPERRVVTLVGDGSFMFAAPTAALCLAAEVSAPILAVVLNNEGYRGSRLPVYELFPDGRSAAQGDAVGSRFRRAPDFAALARACHAHGESVSDRAELVPALRRGLKALEVGQAAVIDVRISPA